MKINPINKLNKIPPKEFDINIIVNSIGVKFKNCFIQPINVGDIELIDNPFNIIKTIIDTFVRPINQRNKIHKEYDIKREIREIVNTI